LITVAYGFLAKINFRRNSMASEQVRAQRDYLDADELARQATRKVEDLSAELCKWQRIERSAQELADLALAVLQPASDIDTAPEPDVQ
jgi:hypothetical protein